MSYTVVRQDVDGELFESNGNGGGDIGGDGSAPRYGKRLPTDTVWHVYEPQDLEAVAGGAVESVRTSLADGAHYVHYHPGLKPLELPALRQLLNLDGPLAAWRVAKLAADLLAHLKALHEADVPQLLVHPDRVGRLDGRFVLLPTLAGVLPPSRGPWAAAACRPPRRGRRCRSTRRCDCSAGSPSGPSRSSR